MFKKKKKNKENTKVTLPKKSPETVVEKPIPSVVDYNVISINRAKEKAAERNRVKQLLNSIDFSEHEDDADVDDGVPEFSYDDEYELRGTDQPYIISQDQYLLMSFENYDTLLYYEGDRVLATTGDEVMSIEDTIGHENLMKFGKLTSDPNAMYIRNERLDTDFEVIRVNGYFKDEVGDE
jgi:hypothetical protein